MSAIILRMWLSRALFVVVVIAVFMCAGPALAATYTWTVATGSAANGSGTWNTTNTNWWNGSTAIAWPNASGGSADTAAFTAASPTVSSTVTLDGTLNVAGVYFSANTYRLQSGTLAIVDSGTVGINGGSKATIASSVTGRNITIRTAGGGEEWMTLSGSNQLTGTTTIANLTRVNAFNTAAFGTSTIDCGSGGGFYPSVSGTFANNVMIGYNGSGNNRGPLRFDASNVTLTGTITMTANSSITTNGANQTVTVAGPITESGGARSLVFGGGFYTLSGASTYSGSTTLNVGRITISGGNDRLPTTTTLSLASTAKLMLGGNSQTLGGLITTATGSVVGGNATASSLILNIASGTNSYSGQLGGSLTNENNLSLRKQGAGTLALSGTGSYTGATTIDAGVLSVSGTQALAGTSDVSIAGAGALRFAGGASTLGKNITVTSGTGSVENTGGGLLTLSGTLTKDGTVLRLAGGAFNVTGSIVGTSANSDLLVAGTSSVTLSTANTYNGPTFVIESSTLAYGINNAIPSNSVVTLGGASSQGTLSMNGFTGAIGGLTFGSSGGTLQLAATSTSAPVLTAAAGTMTLTNGTLDLAGSGTSAGLYRVLSAQSISGSFASITGASAAYQVISSATAVHYQQRAVLGAVTANSPTAAIITGGSAAFTYSVANSALSGGASLSVTGTGLSNVIGTSGGNAGAAGSTGSLSGLVFTGTGIGSQQGTFTVNAPDAFGSQVATGTVTVNVLDHATSSLGASLLTSTTISLGTYNYASNTWESGGATGLFTIYNLASTFGAQVTADLSLLGVTGTANGFTTNLGGYAEISGGDSNQFSVFFDTAGLSGATARSTTFQIAMSDKVGMSGATATNTLYVTAQVIVVPEPGTSALAGMGVAIAGWLACRRQRATHG